MQKAFSNIQQSTRSPAWSGKQSNYSNHRTTVSDSELVLIRGLPGSGKSTMAEVLAKVGYVHLEADMYFMVDGEYRYDRSRIKQAHEWCQQQARRALAQGKRIVVSNTFTTRQEMRPYFEMCTDVRVIEATGNWQNRHGVPDETLQRMAERWEPLTH